MLKDIKILKNSAFKDNRGMLWTTWKKGVFKNIKFMFKHNLASHFPVEVLTLNVYTRLLNLVLTPIMILFVTPIQ